MPTRSLSLERTERNTVPSTGNSKPATSMLWRRQLVPHGAAPSPRQSIASLDPNDIDTREAVKREHGRFHRKVTTHDVLLFQTDGIKTLTKHDAAAIHCRSPLALATKGTVRDARGFTSITKISPSLTAN